MNDHRAEDPAGGPASGGERQIALQLYSIRRELEQDAGRCLDRVQALGIGAVEVAPPTEQLPSRKLAALLRSFKLPVAAIHCELPLDDRAESVAELAKEFGCRRIIWHGWQRDPEFDTLAGVARLAARYNQAQAGARRHGLHFGLHNHWWEFEPVEGVLPYRLFLEQLDPGIFWEIDTYWARTAGLNPADVLTEFGDRAEMLHVKDGPARHGEAMRALGDGVMDFPAILAAASPAVRWLVIELDECDSDIWEAIARSCRYLRGLGAKA